MKTLIKVTKTNILAHAKEKKHKKNEILSLKEDFPKKNEEKLIKIVSNRLDDRKQDENDPEEEKNWEESKNSEKIARKKFDLGENFFVKSEELSFI